jgi:hypothetical protein
MGTRRDGPPVEPGRQLRGARQRGELGARGLRGRDQLHGLAFSRQAILGPLGGHQAAAAVQGVGQAVVADPELGQILRQLVEVDVHAEHTHQLTAP